MPEEVTLPPEGPKGLTVLSVENLRWVNADHTVLDASVAFEELQSFEARTEFSATADDSEPHGVEIWTKANAGDYGEIAEYVPPTPLTPEELRATMPDLTPRQLFLGLYSIGVTEADVDGLLAGDPQGLIEFRKATRIERLHPLVDALGLSLSITPEQIDSLWEWAAAL